MNSFDNIVAGSIDIAYAEAMQRNNTEVAPCHLLAGLIMNPSSGLSKSLKDYRKTIEERIDKLPRAAYPVAMDALRPTAEFSKWLTLASSSAVQRGKKEVGEADLILHINEIFPDIKLNPRDIKISEQEDPPAFLINLIELAKEGKLDPVIGRTAEIRAVMEILGRRNKNNPVLVGPAGVGKTAIVEGLALAIQKEKVPDLLKGKEVYSLELGAITAGTKYRGDFEERIQQVLKFIKARAGMAILFIDEIHQLVGAGRTEGAMDAANLFKPALGRGELHCIGATTPEEYQKYIMGDSALDRRFRSVYVNEPTKEDAVEILMGVKEKLEIHHGIRISDEAIYAAVMLSDQYITDKNLPDKCIDLIDEAASALKLEAEAMPTKLVDLEGKIRSKKIYAQIDKDNDNLKPEIEAMEAEFNEERRQWEQKVRSIKMVSALKNELDHQRFKLEQYELNQDYESASELKYAKIPELQKKLDSFEHQWVLGKRDVATVIARQSSIPLAKIMQSQQENILELEGEINKVVFGQKEAIHRISETLIASHAGLADETRPLGSFLLLGPSGVGKTETAKAIARSLFHNERSMVRLDLSEYSEKHAVAKLIGAPAGYIGYDEGGILTEAIRKHPYSIVLFDEVEKAHPDFADILLQILDDGRLTDNKGRTVNFRNTIIFLTSNTKNLERDFKPEVLGRLDGIIEYNPLDSGALRDIISKRLEFLNARLRDKKVSVILEESCYELLAKRGYSHQYGARPLHAEFDRLIVHPLSRKLLRGELKEGAVTATCNNEKIEFL